MYKNAFALRLRIAASATIFEVIVRLDLSAGRRRERLAADDVCLLRHSD